MQRFLAAAVVAVIAGAGSAALGLLVQIREPEAHDEFSYLLAADTFAHGRLANPTPPSWPHFETFHVLVQPSYASKYPPAQGLVLAIGQTFFGHPMAGVWLSSGLLCAAIAWMLFAYVPPRWAFVGAAIAVAQYSIAGYWSQSYWGGAVAASGGALVYGALRRVVETRRARDGLWLGLGLAVLALSRPFEGAVAALPALLVLAVWGVRELQAGRGAALACVALPPVLVLALAAGFLACLNHRVTGSAWRTPYQEHSAQYLSVPLLAFQPMPEPPPLRHEVMRQFRSTWEIGFYDLQRGWRRRMLTPLWKGPLLFDFYLGVAGAVPLLALPWILRERWNRLLAAVLALLLAVSFFVATFGGFAHYVAPGTALLVALQVEGLRRIARLRWHAAPLGWVVVVAVLVGVGFGLLQRISEHAVPPDHWSRQRAALIERLRASPGRDLVLVRYGQNHHVDHEWVYNGAALDEAEVLFARGMDAESDRELLAAFPGRRAWLLTVDAPGRWGPVLEPLR